MKKLTALFLAAMTVLCLMIPVFASADYTALPDTMWVNCADGKRLNVRSQASTNAKLLYRIECGTRVNVVYTVDSAKGWAYVVPQGHKEGGFVMTKFLVAQKPGKYEITERSDNFRKVSPYEVSCRALNDKTANSVGLRTAPNNTAKMIRRLNAGECLQVVAVGKTWSRVVDPMTGKTGYVANDYLNRE